MQKFIIRVDEENPEILEKMSEDCYLLATSLADEYCAHFIEKANTEDKVVLFYGENAVDKAKRLDADGVILDLGAEKLKPKIAEVRRILGKKKFVGLITRNRRHESMLTAEVEPDFVVFKVWHDGFDKVKELTDWYNEFFLIPSVAWIMGEGVEEDKLSVDFILKGIKGENFVIELA
jgi:hypothetical protein